MQNPLSLFINDRRPRSRLLALSGLALVLSLSLPAAAQDGGDDPPPRLGPGGAPAGAPDDEDAPPERPSNEARPKPPVVNTRAKVTIDFVDTPLSDLIKYMAEITGRNFILTEKIDGKVTIISHQPVSVDAAYYTFPNQAACTQPAPSRSMKFCAFRIESQAVNACR